MVKPAPEKVLVLLDYEAHTRGGHFGHWLAFFAREFARRFDRVLVCTPVPALTKELFQTTEALPSSVSFPGIPVNRKKLFSRRFRKRSLGKIFHDAARLAPSGDLSGFVMWGYDLLDDGLAANPAGVPWGTLATLSWEQRKFGHEAAAKDARLRALCQSRPDCAGMLTADNFIVSPALAKSRWIPGMENLRLPGDAPPEVAEAKRRAAGRLVVGGAGLLNGRRCVNELLRLSAEHPELFFLLAGQLDRGSIQPDLLQEWEAGKLENVFLAGGFLEEPKLNALIHAMDLVFIDGANYPVHSSIVNKALHFGKFVLTTESDSWTRDTIDKWKVGRAYANRAENFGEQFRDWQNSGGPERARAAAGELMSAGALAACFDGMTRALTNPADLPEK